MTLFELRNGEKLFGSEKASMASGIDPRFRNSGAQHVELEREKVRQRGTETRLMLVAVAETPRWIFKRL